MIIRCLAGGGGCEMQEQDTKLSNYLVYQVHAEIAGKGERGKFTSSSLGVDSARFKGGRENRPNDGAEVA